MNQATVKAASGSTPCPAGAKNHSAASTVLAVSKPGSGHGRTWHTSAAGPRPSLVSTGMLALVGVTFPRCHKVGVRDKHRGSSWVQPVQIPRNVVQVPHCCFRGEQPAGMPGFIGQQLSHWCHVGIAILHCLPLCHVWMQSLHQMMMACKPASCPLP